MRRALAWLILYGCEAVRHKLKNRQKNAFFAFLGHFKKVAEHKSEKNINLCLKMKIRI
jgi:hypothetical protein